MPIPITLRNVGSAAILVGLVLGLIASTSAWTGLIGFAWLLVFAGVGLRIEAALRKRNVDVPG